MSRAPLIHRAAAGESHRRLYLHRERSGPTGPVESRDAGPAGTSPSLDAIGINPDHLYGRTFDFDGAVGASLPAGVSKWDVSSAGTPTADYDADAAAGTYTFAHDNTDEAQIIGLYGGDNRSIPAAGQPIFQARVKLTPGGDTMSADQRFVVGLCSDVNTTLDSVATHAWFRVEGANLNLLYESDDGTTDDDDNDSGVDIAKGTFITLRIDLTDLSRVSFQVNAEAGAGFVEVGTTDMSAASGTLQVVCALQKDAGTETDAATVDYIQFASDRA